MNRLRQPLLRLGRSAPLTWQIAVFLFNAPRLLERTPLPELLQRLHALPRPRFRDVAASQARIARLRRRWLRKPFFRSRDTCYTRALTLFRFLDARGHDLRIHYGVEVAGGSEQRPRGHAWVSVDGEILEPPDPVAAGRVRELFAFPPASASRRPASCSE